MSTVSFYKNVRDVKSRDMRDLDDLLNDIQSGTYEDAVTKIRVLKQQGKDYSSLKKELPAFTVSGVFEKRDDNSLTKHSGFIAIDLDHLDDVDHYNRTFEELCRDPYTYAMFRSVGGAGICVIIKIKNTDRHRELFKGYSEYLYTNYQLITDPTAVNPSRLRFVSFDPDMFISTSVKNWSKMAKEKKIPARQNRERLYVKNDFDALIETIEKNMIDITGGYNEWLRIGFGLHHHFGNAGFDYFDRISQYSPMYDMDSITKQWGAISKHDKGHGCTIATVYYFAKLKGLQIHSSSTVEASIFAAAGKKSGRSKETVIEQLRERLDLSGDDVNSVVDQIYTYDDIDVPQLDDEVDNALLFLNSSYDVKYNKLTQRVEVDGKALEDRMSNTIWLNYKRQFPKAKKEILFDLINSYLLYSYHPFFNWLEKYKDVQPVGEIEKLFSAIRHKMPDIDGQNWSVYFGTRWLVGLINNIINPHQGNEDYYPCLYIMVLTGAGNSGKSTFFRRILPKELGRYFRDNKLNSKNDSDNLEPLTSNLVMFDDELSGKKKSDDAYLKDVLSKTRIQVRLPYAKHPIDLPRISVFCGTSNEKTVITDPTGNRRVIPIEVESIDFDVTDSIDRNLVLKEAYDLFMQGMSWEMPKDVLQEFSKLTDDFKDLGDEHNYFNEVFTIPDESNKTNGQYYTTAEIIKIIAANFPYARVPSVRKMSLLLSNLNLVSEQKKINGINARRYLLIRNHDFTHYRGFDG